MTDSNTVNPINYKFVTILPTAVSLGRYLKPEHAFKKIKYQNTDGLTDRKYSVLYSVHILFAPDAPASSHSTNNPPQV